MTTLVHHCPHCATNNISFNIRSQAHLKIGESRHRNFLYLQCPNCGMPSCVELRDRTGATLMEPSRYPQGLIACGWQIVHFWPSPPKPRIPEYLPDQVARAYLSAERNFVAKDMEEAAAGSYGRALDIGTKIIAPEIDKMLFGRIKDLADQHRLTPDLAVWAHEIRLIRNYAMHEVDGTTREELIAIRGFTEMVLTYLFTLPGMLAARKADADTPAG